MPIGTDRDGRIVDIIAAGLAPQEFDERLLAGMAQLAERFEGLADWYRRRGDFAMMPGAAVLRHVAHTAHGLATALQVRADQIDE